MNDFKAQSARQPWWCIPLSQSLGNMNMDKPLGSNPAWGVIKIIIGCEKQQEQGMNLEYFEFGSREMAQLVLKALATLA